MSTQRTLTHILSATALAVALAGLAPTRAPAATSTTRVIPAPTAAFVGSDALAAATGPDRRIYAIGGDDGNNPLSTVEVYNPRTNTWTTLSPSRAGGGSGPAGGAPRGPAR